jgi:hypothetical protein
VQHSLLQASGTLPDAGPRGKNAAGQVGGCPLLCEQPLGAGKSLLSSPIPLMAAVAAALAEAGAEAGAEAVAEAAAEAEAEAVAEAVAEALNAHGGRGDQRAKLTLSTTGRPPRRTSITATPRCRTLA